VDVTALDVHRRLLSSQRTWSFTAVGDEAFPVSGNDDESLVELGSEEATGRGGRSQERYQKRVLARERERGFRHFRRQRR